MRNRGAVGSAAMLIILVCLVVAADYGVFLYRQRHGDVLSFAHVDQYIAVNDDNGHYHYEYFGHNDIPCVVALLPHQNLPACWWVHVHEQHWM